MSSQARETKVLTDFLKLYKEFRCLWDTSCKTYCNRQARDNALDVLVSKLKEFDKDATTATVRKKLENLRCSYKRERKKVLEHKKNGVEPHVPRLWYYDLLSFLDGDTEELTDSTYDEEASDAHNDVEQQPPSKKRRIKQEPNNDNTFESIAFYPHEVLLTTQDTDTHDNAQESTLPTPSAKSDSALYYGAAVGHQLKEMSYAQRCLAEKLISEVIFHGKMSFLTINSRVSLNDK